MSTHLAPIANIQAVVADYYLLPVRIMRSHDVASSVAHARQMAMYLAHTVLGKSKSEVARRFDRDRSTVWHAIQAVEQRAANDLAISADIAALRSRLAA